MGCACASAAVPVVITKCTAWLRQHLSVLLDCHNKHRLKQLPKLYHHVIGAIVGHCWAREGSVPHPKDGTWAGAASTGAALPVAAWM